jgi:hypothetical protein
MPSTSAPPPESTSTRQHRLLQALLIYSVVTLAVFVFAAPETLSRHTPFNHFALLAESWLHGRLDLIEPPPHRNDFAFYAGKHYVVFPPFPALLILPLVAVEGGARAVRDGAFFLALAGIGPAVLFLALEKLRRLGQSVRTERENLTFALLFAFGSVYFFSAVQGTVWFAAHVVGVALAALYLLCALGADRPFLAGIVLGLAFATRPPIAYAAPLFLLEAIRAAALPDAPSLLQHPVRYLRSLDMRALGLRLAGFALPLAAIATVLLLQNAVRFGDPFEFGYRYLTIAWRERIEKWGLFSYHYFPRNLAVLLASLPWRPLDGVAPFLINYHGLALWFTTPLYLSLPWPKRRPQLLLALWLAALAAAIPSLFYQNTGWIQFGQRFSNDYAVFLFALLALGGWSFRGPLLFLAAWSVLVNAFGAATFGRPEYERFYFFEPTQRVLFQPD